MNKIPPISPNANNFSNFDGRNSHNNQNFKDSSKDSKEKQNFLDTIQQILKEQSEEHNNDSTNTITNRYTTAQILTPTNPYGSGNGGNNRLDRRTQGQSAIIEKDGRSNTTAHNGGFTQLLGEKDKRSRRVGDGGGNLEAGSGKITRLRNAKAYTTATERSRLYKLEVKYKKAFNAYKEPYRQNLLSTIEDNLQYVTDNPNIDSIKKVNKLLNVFKQNFPESKHNIAEAEKQLAPLKKKYLPQKTKENIHKSKSKSNDDFGIGM